MQPHAGQRVVRAGAPLDTARAAMIMIHGRNAAPENILDLVPVLDRDDFAYIAPAASGGTWYPLSFMAPREHNEPGISSGLFVIESIVTDLTARGFPPHAIMLLGFSQGACLSLEYAARHARRYGGIATLSGGLIGPDGTPRDYSGNFDGTPAFLGCSDIDGHIPARRVTESAEVLERMGARATMKLYPGMGHLVNDDEIAFVRAMMTEVAGTAQL